MAWTRERIAYDLIGHKYRNISLITRFAVRQSYAFITAIATTIIGIHTYMR
jgi:hypothetical protein